MIEHNQETKNAIIAIDAIKRMGIADSETEIAKTISYNKTSLNNVKSSNRNLPSRYMNALIANYHINSNFLYKNTLPIFDPKGPYDKYNNIADPSNQDINERLDRIEENQLKIMDLLLKLTQK